MSFVRTLSYKAYVHCCATWKYHLIFDHITVVPACIFLLCAIITIVYVSYFLLLFYIGYNNLIVYSWYMYWNYQHNFSLIIMTNVLHIKHIKAYTNWIKFLQLTPLYALSRTISIAYWFIIMSLEYDAEGSIDNKSALAQVMAWCWNKGLVHYYIYGLKSP